MFRGCEPVLRSVNQEHGYLAAAYRRNTILDAGFPDYTHETGYSIGVCYPPGWNESHIMNLHPGDDTVLRPNMVFHLVPSLIIPEMNGHVGFSDTVVVTENGCEVLTDSEVERRLHVVA